MPHSPPEILNKRYNKCKSCFIYSFDSPSNPLVVSILRVVAELEKKNPDQVDTFKTNVQKAVKDILPRFKDLQFFTGESMDCDATICLLEYRDKEDGTQDPILMFFKHGLVDEKL